jgi:hypothetical protein
MKKFSKQINQKMTEEPKQEFKIDEARVFKNKILGLMDSYLKVVSHGPVDDRYLAGNVSIDGKEMLAEAFVNLLSEESSNKQTAILESLKSKIGDWEAIDNLIDSINENNIKIENKFKFDSMIRKYSSDEDSLLMIMESKASSINNNKTINDYINLIKESKLSQDSKHKAQKIYNTRKNELPKEQF